MDSSYKYEPVVVPIYGNGNNGGVDEAISSLEEQVVTAADTPSLNAQLYLEFVAPATLPEVGWEGVEAYFSLKMVLIYISSHDELFDT